MPLDPMLDYGMLFDALPQSYLLIDADDPEFTLIAENQAHADVAMMPLNQAMGKPFLEAYPDNSPKFKKTGVSDIIESLRRVVRDGQPDVMETLRYDLKGPDGKLERRYWRATHYPIFGADGRVARILQNAVNVTDQVITSRKLDEARRQLSEALAVGLIGTWLWDLKEDYVVADTNLLRLFGIDEAEAADGLPLKQFTNSIHPDDRPRITEIIGQTVAACGSFEEEYRTLSGDGEIRWVIARGRVETEDGKAVRFPGAVVDITERKQAERNAEYLAQVGAVLGTSLDYTETLKSVAGLAVGDMADWCTIDLLEDGDIRLVGIAHRDPAKISWARKLRRAYPVRLDNPTGIAHVLRTGEPLFLPNLTEAMLRASAEGPEQLKVALSLNLTSWISVPLIVDGKPIGVLSLISSDLKRHYTEQDLRLAEEVAARASIAIVNANLYRTAQDEIRTRIGLEERLRLANEHLESRVQKRTAQLEDTNRNLERSNRELQDFAYVASHDLQEPLRKIQAFGNLLEEEYGDKLSDGRDYLERMRNAASRMSVLIEDLLSFSRVTTKASPPVAVDLNTIVHEVLEDLEISVRESAAEIKIGKLPVVLADQLQMRQLMQNLIGNALKFTADGVAPRIGISSKSRVRGQAGGNGTMEFCQVQVKDNGIGFDEKYLDRIFAVFQRLHGRDGYQGTGIGLAICRKIAERHGGSITATSQPGYGSTFIVNLPLAPVMSDSKE